MDLLVEVSYPQYMGKCGVADVPLAPFGTKMAKNTGCLSVVKVHLKDS
jgi:hypothetical protein